MTKGHVVFASDPGPVLHKPRREIQRSKKKKKPNPPRRREKTSGGPLTLPPGDPGRRSQPVWRQRLRSTGPSPPPARRSPCKACRPPAPATGGPTPPPSRTAPSETPGGETDQPFPSFPSNSRPRRKSAPSGRCWRSSSARRTPDHRGSAGPDNRRDPRSGRRTPARCKSSPRPTGYPSAAGKTGTARPWRTDGRLFNPFVIHAALIV